MGATTMGMSLRSSQDSLINRDYQLGNNKRHSLIKPLGMAYDCTRGVAALGAPGVAVGAVVVAIGVEDVRGISSCGLELRGLNKQ